ncbi:hypothetical protein [Pseudomonas mediterranea]
MLACLRAIEKRGALNVARKCRRHLPMKRRSTYR